MTSVFMHNSPTRFDLRKPDKLRPSLDSWAKAIVKAQEAQTILVKCDCSSLNVWEEDGQRGLRCLEERSAH